MRIKAFQGFKKKSWQPFVCQFKICSDYAINSRYYIGLYWSVYNNDGHHTDLPNYARLVYT